MKMRTIQITTIVAFTLFAVQSASAGSMRCGSHTISDGGRHGPGKYEVLKRCGEPTVRSGNNWVYDTGQKRYVVVFKDSGTISTVNQLIN